MSSLGTSTDSKTSPSQTHSWHSAETIHASSPKERWLMLSSCWLHIKRVFKFRTWRLVGWYCRQAVGSKSETFLRSSVCSPCRGQIVDLLRVSVSSWATQTIHSLPFSCSYWERQRESNEGKHTMCIGPGWRINISIAWLVQHLPRGQCRGLGVLESTMTNYHFLQRLLTQELISILHTFYGT